MPTVAAATNISKENLYKWEKGVKPSNIDEYFRLKNYLDAEDNTNIVSDVAPDPKAITSTPLHTSIISIFLTQDYNVELYTDKKGNPGSIIHVKEQPALIACRNESAIIGEVDGLIPVTGESMEPRFESGSWIAIRRLKFIRIINAGYYYYIIDINLKPLLRKVVLTNTNNTLTLLSENEAAYPAITRNFEDILAIFSVEAVITKQSV